VSLGVADGFMVIQCRPCHERYTLSETLRDREVLQECRRREHHHIAAKLGESQEITLGVH